jgi:hypothetical protein
VLGIDARRGVSKLGEDGRGVAGKRVAILKDETHNA